jgi:hypothetical protein
MARDLPCTVSPAPPALSVAVNEVVTSMLYFSDLKVAMLFLSPVWVTETALQPKQQ